MGPDRYITLWTDILDIIGPTENWPKIIRKLFWTKDVKHWDRVMLATFVYYNGLNPIVLMEWANLFGLCHDKNAENEFHSLFKASKEGKHYNLYAYIVLTGRYEYYDGRSVQFQVNRQ